MNGIKASKQTPDDSYTVACYYFPNYHIDPRNERQHGPGWTEWELVKGARPRFKEHEQPKEPLWGYEDESDPLVMARRIDAAASHGIDAFIFDWYWYDDGPFLEGGLEQGFLGAPNNDRLKFAVMWANHDWLDIHPDKYGVKPQVLYPGKVTPATFDAMTDHLVERHFSRPSCWTIDGCPYFSFYDLTQMIATFGSVQATRTGLGRFRDKVKAAGFADLHLNAVVWGETLLPCDQVHPDNAALVRELRLDSVTSYVWIHHTKLRTFPTSSYPEVLEHAAAYWEKAKEEFHVPYYPNVTMGWDSTPRTTQTDVHVNKGYPWTPIIVNNTPEAFQNALRRARAFLSGRPANQRILTLNCWNEWTEGSYLEPDKRHGMAYLEAVKTVFGSKTGALAIDQAAS
jgi:hypothetical protein